MAIKKNAIGFVRNWLYRRYQKAGKRFRKVNRALLREVSPAPAPINSATAITDRASNDTWKTLQPVWVLSTGRTGTNTLTELLKLSPALDAFHEPSPELFDFSYDYYQGNIAKKEALKALEYARDELVFRSFRDGFIYVETNNRVSYIAELLLELYPESKFLYMYRNPYDFIRSGMRRKYYTGHLRDAARITPPPSDPFFDPWDTFDDIEKVAWNWRAANEHCLRFMDGINESQKMNMSSEDFFEAEPSLIQNLFDFAGSGFYHPPASDMHRVMGKKINAQTKGSFARPKGWTEEQIKKVDPIIAPVAHSLGYGLLSKDSSNIRSD